MTTTPEKSDKKAMPRGRPIMKGQVLNPGGRPKKTPEELDLIAACKGKTPEALTVLVNMMTSGEQEKNRLTAALAIIERAYGKPVQPQDVSVAGTLIHRIERIIVDASTKA